MDKKEKLDALKLALTNELKEKEFYLKHAERTSNALGKEMFLSIAGDEDEHYSRLIELYSKLEERETWPEDFSTDISSSKVSDILSKVIDDAMKAEEVDVEDEKAVEVAIAFEGEAEKFYSGLAEKADNEKEKKFFELLSSMEREHRLSLQDTLDYFKDPQGWLERKGGRHLDGA